MNNSGRAGLGLGLGGGIGLSMRQHGLACDSIIGAKIVVANGSLVSPLNQAYMHCFMLDERASIQHSATEAAASLL